jgi:hypothetical protein
MSAPVCAQCGRTGWDITVGGVDAAPLTLEWIHSTYAETLCFCDTLCLLRWAVEQRESVVRFWHNAWTESAGDVNHVLRATLMDRILIGRWWRKRVDRRGA